MKAISYPIALFVLAIALAGCGSSPPVRYYSLDTMHASYETDAGDVVALGLGPLRMTESLAGSRIKTRGLDSEVIVDDFNRWIEPLEDALHRITAANIDGLLDGVVVVAFPYSHFTDLDYQLIGRVDRFDADTTGSVVLLVQWTVLTLDSEIVVPPRRARYDAQAANPGDYGSLATAMSEVIADFSRDVASRLEEAVP